MANHVHITSKLKISTKGLLRLELIIAFVLTNVFAFGLVEFGLEEYDRWLGFLLSSLFLLFFFFSFILNLGNSFLKKGTLVLYTLSLLVVLYPPVSNHFDQSYYFAFLFIYAFVSFAQNRINQYLIFSGLIYLAILLSAIWLGIANLKLSFLTLNIAFLIVFLNGLAITFSRRYMKDKLISRQKEVEKSEQSYRDLFNNSSELLYLIDQQNKFVDINKSVLDTYGYTKDELMQLDPTVLAAPGKNDLEKLNRITAEAMAKDQEVNFFFWSQKKDGSIFPKEMNIKKGIYRSKTVMMITGRDISEAYYYRQELEKKEKRYRDLFERNLAGVYRTDKEGRILECNAAFARMFGFESHENIKQDEKAQNFYLNPKDREKMLEKVHENGFIEGWQLRLKKRNEETLDVLVNVSRIKTEKGEYYEGNLIDISELSRTQEQLKLSQQKYQHLVDHSSFGILIITKKEEVVFSNIKASTIFGYKKPSDIQGKKVEEIIGSKQLTELRKLFSEVSSGKIDELIELSVNDLQNNRVEIEISASVILFGNEKAMQLSFIDISDRHKAEKAQEKMKVTETFNKILQAELAEKEEAQKKLIDAQSYMEGIIESSLDMIFTTDLEGRINKLNGAAQKELRVKHEEILNMPLKSIFSSQKRSEEIFDRLKSANSFSGEVELKRSDESIFPSYFSLSYLYNSEGIKLGIMGVSRDISDIKQKEIEINKQAAKLNAVIESSSHFFFTVNKHYQITSYNHVFESDLKQNMGIKLKSDPNFFDLIQKNDPEEFEKLKAFWEEKFEKVFRGVSCSFEIKRKDIHGNDYYQDFYLNPINIESDQVEEISGIGHDITSKKLSEENLKSSLQEKEVLLKEVHHRVKNNMQVISSILSLQSSYIQEPKTLNILRESQNRIKSMAFIHERLYRTKDFSKINFSDYIENLSTSLINTYEAGNVKVNVSFDLDEVFLNLDSAIPCGLILNELISNSLKYAFKGRKRGNITVKLKEEENKTVKFSVQDDGVGIDKEFNISKTETLGLQLVHTLTEQLEGKLKLTLNKGSRFDITFSKSA
jgi:PAS domain S-box-containing protein